MVTKRQALERLRVKGLELEAATLDSWRNVQAGNGGWDGYFRKSFPEHCPTIGLEARETHAASRASLGEGETTRTLDEESTPLEWVEWVEPFLTPGPSLSFLPDVIVHADWSANPHGGKRQFVRAERHESYYVLAQPAPVRPGLLDALVREAEEGKSVLVGFDLVLGLPVAYARAARLAAKQEGLELGDSFLEMLGRLPPEFFEPGDDPSGISWRRPFFAKSNAGWKKLELLAPRKGDKHHHLARRILLDTAAKRESLLRAAERSHAYRRDGGSPLFVLTGAAQVGRASLSGWQELLLPSLGTHAARVRVWPFHGSLDTLVRPGTVTLVETYPAECYVHLGIGNKNKKNSRWRVDASIGALALACSRGVLPSSALLELAETGFGPEKAGEDPFDAMIGAVVLALVALGHDSAADPTDADALSWEGWILGRPAL